MEGRGGEGRGRDVSMEGKGREREGRGRDVSMEGT